MWNFYQRKYLEKYPLEFKPVFFKRYVENILVLFKSTDHLKKFGSYFNTCHSNISFSFEKEKIDKLSCLDVKISWVKGKLVTTVYRRPTFSGDYTHFDSFLPYTHKFGMLYTLVHSCFTLCSDWSKFLRELMTLKENSKEMVIQRYLEIMFWRSF